MNTRDQNIAEIKEDIEMIKRNFSELESILKRIENEFRNKSQILDAGIKEYNALKSRLKMSVSN